MIQIIIPILQLLFIFIKTLNINNHIYLLIKSFDDEIK